MGWGAPWILILATGLLASLFPHGSGGENVINIGNIGDFEGAADPDPDKGPREAEVDVNAWKRTRDATRQLLSGASLLLRHRPRWA